VGLDLTRKTNHCDDFIRSHEPRDDIEQSADPFLIIATAHTSARGRESVAYGLFNRSLIKRGGILSTQAPDFKRTPKADAALEALDAHR
jgi:hypothetical protein